MARAGGQILRDALRRKLNAEFDNPNYDDQGQEMETPGWDDDPDWATDRQLTNKMRRPNPDGTFDGPTGGRPLNPPDMGDNYGEGPKRGVAGPEDYEDEEDMEEDPYDVRAQAEGRYDPAVDRQRRDAMEAGERPNSDADIKMLRDRLATAGGKGDGDSGIAMAVGAEIGKLLSEGYDGPAIRAAMKPLVDGYAIQDEQMVDDMIAEQLQNLSKKNVHRGMGKPIGPGQ